MGHKERRRPELFVSGSLRQLVPADHILARVDRVLDLSWLREEVAGDLLRRQWPAWDRPRGRGAADALRLSARRFHNRRLMREAQVNIAIRWFVGCGLHEVLPDHSSLTRIRQRWAPSACVAF